MGWNSPRLAAAGGAGRCSFRPRGWRSPPVTWQRAPERGGAGSGGGGAEFGGATSGLGASPRLLPPSSAGPGPAAPRSSLPFPSPEGGLGGAMSDLGDWFRSIPLITRYWFAGSIAVPLVGKLGLVSPVYLFLWPDAFINRFQVRAALRLPACLAALPHRKQGVRRARHAGSCSARRRGGGLQAGAWPLCEGETPRAPTRPFPGLGGGLSPPAPACAGVGPRPAAPKVTRAGSAGPLRGRKGEGG